jgi:hypothetical protein
VDKKETNEISWKKTDRMKHLAVKSEILEKVSVLKGIV